MALPLQYNLRNLTVRRTANIMAALGIALVVMVMVWVLALAQGFRKAIVGTGRPDRALVMRGGATSEVQSAVSREDARLLAVLPEVATSESGESLASPEMVVIVVLPKRSDASPSNVVVRGVTEAAFAVRPEARIAEGRAVRPGLGEVVVGRALSRRIQGCEVGARLHFAAQDWEVVGILEAGGSGFESEIWGDAEVLIPAFERTGYQVVTMRLRNAGDLKALQERIDADPRLHLDAQSELEYFESQSRSFTTFVRGTGFIIAILMGFGAIAGALNTMYAAVNARTREIGTLLALGFSRASVLGAFMLESVVLSLAGGAIGCGLGLLVNGVSTGTTNWDSFSELAFTFRVTPDILITGMVFAAVMGAVGGLLPAWRAARKRIVDSLRAA